MFLNFGLSQLEESDEVTFQDTVHDVLMFSIVKLVRGRNRELPICATVEGV